MADAATKAKFPDAKCTIKASDGYVFTSPVGHSSPTPSDFTTCTEMLGSGVRIGTVTDYYAKSPTDDPTGPDSGSYPCHSGRFLLSPGRSISGVPPVAAGACRASDATSQASVLPGLNNASTSPAISSLGSLGGGKRSTRAEGGPYNTVLTTEGSELGVGRAAVAA